MLSQIPPKVTDFGDPREYYQMHYAGLTRGQLEKTKKGLYNRLRRDGLLHAAPTINAQPALKAS